MEQEQKVKKNQWIYRITSYNVCYTKLLRTEGKTGFKNQLYSLLSKQISVHAKLDSSNLNVPIMCSLASISKDDKVEIIEASRITSYNVCYTKLLRLEIFI